MKLARKLTLALVVGIVAVMAVNAWVRTAREVAFLDVDVHAEERLLGRLLRTGAQAAWRDGGLEGVRDLVRRSDDSVSEVRIRWIDFDAPEGDPDQPAVDPSRVLASWDGASIVRITADAGDRRYAYVPVPFGDGTVGTLELSELLLRERRHLQLSVVQSLVAAVVVSVACALIAVGTGFWFVGRPIALLRDQARRVGAGDLSMRVRVPQRDEIGELATEINQMCERLEVATSTAKAATEARIAALEQLRHADRLSTVGQLASGVAHELGTPLNVVAGWGKLIATGELDREETARSARVIVEQTERMTAIIRQLLAFARRRGPTRGPHDVCRIVEQTVALLAPLADKRRVRMAASIAVGPLQAEVDEAGLQQALTNLAMNGIQAMPNGGRLEIAVDTCRARPPEVPDAPDAEHVRIAVHDDGLGIVPEHLAHVFEPFFTTKGVGEGTGLGLSVAYGIVREHGGWIAVESAPGRGTTFAIYVRRLDGEAPGAGQDA